MQGDAPTWSRPVPKWGSMMCEKRVRVGNQTALSAKRLTEPFEYAVENGFDAFEWFLAPHRMDDGWEEADLAPEERREIGRTAAENDIMLSVHVPWRLDPFEPEGYEHLARSLEFAMDMGAANLNMHLSSEHGIEAFEKTLSPVLHRLADLPIRLSIENIPSSSPTSSTSCLPGLRTRGSTSEGSWACASIWAMPICPLSRAMTTSGLSTGWHPMFRLCTCTCTRTTATTTPTSRCSRARPRGHPSGIEGFVDRMKRRGFSGCGILEVWPDPPSLLNRARDRLLRMFNSHRRGASGENCLVVLGNPGTRSRSVALGST